MNKENRNLVNLDDNELDNIVGGAFNQNFIAQYNLKTLTGKSGAQGLIVKSVCFQSSTDGFSGMSSQGPCSEKRLAEQNRGGFACRPTKLLYRCSGVRRGLYADILLVGRG